MKAVFINLFERGIAILSYIFPFLEISAYFGTKVFLNAESLSLQYFYRNYISKLVNIYQDNTYFAFALMIGIFFICSKGSLPLSKFVRFNIIQAILLYIICSCVGQILGIYCPAFIRESTIGIVLANFVYLGTLVLILYSSVLILFGRYPRIPVISEAARIQVQRSY
jgi:uncharacterized membrane protein